MITHLHRARRSREPWDHFCEPARICHFKCPVYRSSKTWHPYPKSAKVVFRMAKVLTGVRIFGLPVPEKVLRMWGIRGLGVIG